MWILCAVSFNNDLKAKPKNVLVLILVIIFYYILFVKGMVENVLQNCVFTTLYPDPLEPKSLKC